MTTTPVSDRPVRPQPNDDYHRRAFSAPGKTTERSSRLAVCAFGRTHRLHEPCFACARRCSRPTQETTIPNCIRWPRVAILAQGSLTHSGASGVPNKRTENTDRTRCVIKAPFQTQDRPRASSANVGLHGGESNTVSLTRTTGSSGRGQRHFSSLIRRLRKSTPPPWPRIPR